MDEMNYQLDLLTAMNEKLLGSDKMFRMICGTSSNAFLYYDYADDHFEILGGFDSLFPFSMQRHSDLQKIIESVLPQYQSELEDVLYCERTRKDSQGMECELNQGKRWVEFEVTISYNRNNLPSEKIICIRDITKSKVQTDELKYLAYYDTLTGLFNRNYFVQSLSDWVRRAKDENTCVDVLYIKLNNYRKVNDSLGLIMGDELLQLFGQMLSDFQSENVIVSHFTDDVYYIAVYDSDMKMNADTIYDEIIHKLVRPFSLSIDNRIMVTINCGVAQYPESASSSLELINLAEIARSKKNQSFQNTIHYFNSPMLSDYMENIQIENQLKEAIDEGVFQLHYQPQFDALTKQLRGVEALIRWKNRNDQYISPGVFIPLAEKDGLIVEIGEWVIDEALKTLSKWNTLYNFELVMSINISAIQFKRPDFVRKLLEYIQKYDVNPGQIELEITESIVIDDINPVVDKLIELRNLGIKISLDDFGTGYSSLSYLKGMPIDTLKIDKSFIDTVIQDNSTKIITESIIQMVKKLGCETVAEGVETMEQLKYLEAIECDNIQGFLLGKPMPQEEMESLFFRKKANGGL